MGTAKMGPLIFSMALPAMISMIINALYNIVDSIFVAKYSQDALAAVSLVYPLQMLVVAIGVGTGVGVNSLIARRLGERRQEAADLAAEHGVALSVIGGIAFFIIGWGLSGAFVGAFGASEAVSTNAVQYSHIAVGMSIFVLISMMCEKIQQSGGNMIIPMCQGLAGAIINIILDPILIFGLGWGVRGAAVATVLSQAVGACWILKFLTGPKTILKLRKENLKVERNIILPVMGLGISTFVMLSTESLLSISFSSSLARYGGDVAVGAMTVITSASQLCTLPIQGICQGGQPVMSFNFGAGKKPRVKEAFRFQLTLCFGYTTLFWLLMMLVPGVVAGIFTSDAALIEYTTWAMRIYMAGILAMGVQIACQQSFMALGQAKVSLLLACLRKIILLIPLIFILPCFTADKCFGVFLAEPVSDILAATITAITFFSRFDKILDKGAGKV